MKLINAEMNNPVNRNGFLPYLSECFPKKDWVDNCRRFLILVINERRIGDEAINTA